MCVRAHEKRIFQQKKASSFSSYNVQEERLAKSKPCGVFPRGKLHFSFWKGCVCVLSAGKGVGGEQSAIRHLELYEMKALFKEDCNHSTDSCDGELLLRFAGCCLGPNALCLHHMDLQTHASGGPAG